MVADLSQNILVASVAHLIVMAAAAGLRVGR
jgi:hypothetical protein